MRTTIPGNPAWNGGGMWAATTVHVAVPRIVGNRAANDGGGMLIRALTGLGPAQTTPVTVRRTLIARNRAGRAGSAIRLIGDVDLRVAQTTILIGSVPDGCSSRAGC